MKANTASIANWERSKNNSEPRGIRPASAADCHTRLLPQPPAPAEYRIVAGDIIHIDVKASGLSALELAGLIQHKLEGKVQNPQVTVTVVARHGTNLPLYPMEPTHAVIGDAEAAEANRRPLACRCSTLQE
jgi:hypothetical protein